jgi:hypothetical protein
MKVYPGDDLVPDANVTIDRWLPLAAPPDEVWPWLVQLGKRRAGWYLPRSVERCVPPSRRGARALVPAYQGLRVGDDVPDWGPGDPVFRVAVLSPGAVLGYLSLRDRNAGWRWPADGQRGDGVLALSWTLRLVPVGDARSTLHIRLRLVTAQRPWSPLLGRLGSAIDLLTIVLLHRGLSERLR